MAFTLFPSPQKSRFTYTRSIIVRILCILIKLKQNRRMLFFQSNDKFIIKKALTFILKIYGNC